MITPGTEQDLDTQKHPTAIRHTKLQEDYKYEYELTQMKF